MCNVVIQSGQQIRPQGILRVRLEEDGRSAEGVFAGSARRESRAYWSREGAEPCLIPDVSGFGESNERDGGQSFETLPEGSSLRGFLLPPKVSKTGAEYRLLKVMTRPATAEEYARLGNERMPIVEIAS